MLHRLTTLVVLAIALSALSTAQAGLVAYYSFDDDFTDSSINGNDLSVAGGTPSITSTAGEVAFGGGALNLAYPNSFLSTTSTISFGASDPWSVSFWGKRRAGADIRSGMVVGDSDANDFIWTPDNPGAVQGLRFRPTGGGSADFPTAVDTDYHHWVVVADGSGNVRTYRDNVDLGSLVFDTTFNIDSVGSGLASTTNNYDGQIDELYIFDEAIGADVVDSLFNSNVIPEPTSLALAGTALIAVGCLRRRSTS